MNALLGTALMTACFVVFVRRRAVGCPFEGSPTTVVISAGAAAYLTSTDASHRLGRFLHSIFGIWNFEDLLGHVALMVCVAAAVHIFMIRFGNDEMYWSMALQPILISVPLLVTCRAFGEVGQQYIENFDEAIPCLWMKFYWGILFTAAFWLLILAGGFALNLRITDGHDRHSRFVLNTYLTAIATTMMSLSVLSVQVYTNLDVRVAAFILLYIATSCWAVAPGYAWWRRSRPLVIGDPSEMADWES